MSKNNLLLITYGMYFVTAKSEVGWIYMATENWLKQAIFKPINVVLSTKADCILMTLQNLMETLFALIREAWCSLCLFKLMVLRLNTSETTGEPLINS